LTGRDNDNPRLNAPAVRKLFSAPPLSQPAFLTTLLLRRPNGTPWLAFTLSASQRVKPSSRDVIGRGGGAYNAPYLPARTSVAKASQVAPLNRLATNGGKKGGLSNVAEKLPARGIQAPSSPRVLYTW